MKIEIIKCLQDNYAYLVIDKTKSLAVVIDIEKLIIMILGLQLPSHNLTPCLLYTSPSPRD